MRFMSVTGPMRGYGERARNSQMTPATAVPNCPTGIDLGAGNIAMPRLLTIRATRKAVPNGPRSKRFRPGSFGRSSG
jgi:hypothetical protein